MKKQVSSLRVVWGNVLIVLSMIVSASYIILIGDRGMPISAFRFVLATEKEQIVTHMDSAPETLRKLLVRTFISSMLFLLHMLTCRSAFRRVKQAKSGRETQVNDQTVAKLDSRFSMIYIEA